MDGSFQSSEYTALNRWKLWRSEIIVVKVATWVKFNFQELDDLKGRHSYLIPVVWCPLQSEAKHCSSNLWGCMLSSYSVYRYLLYLYISQNAFLLICDWVFLSSALCPYLINSFKSATALKTALGVINRTYLRRIFNRTQGGIHYLNYLCMWCILCKCNSTLCIKFLSKFVLWEIQLLLQRALLHLVKHNISPNVYWVAALVVANLQKK